MEYLGRYTHRVAIANSRILSIENGMASFKWRNYKEASRLKVMTVTAEEFIRRFLIHILPPRVMKIRHYGLLGNRNKSTKLMLCKKMTNTPIFEKRVASTAELVQKITGVNASCCLCCSSERRSRLVTLYNSA